MNELFLGLLRFFRIILALMKESIAYHYLGEQFETTSIFRRHVQAACQHESRVPVIICYICYRKLHKIENQIFKHQDRLTINANTTESPKLNQRDIENVDGHSTPDALVDYRSIISHMYQKHVKLIYRCNRCPRAFVKKDAIYDHQARDHDTRMECAAEVCNGMSLQSSNFGIL